MNKNRLEAFSDGVIAIIITIMVLELKVPHSPELSSLRELAPVLLSYLLSFIYVGIYWNNHHHLLHAAHQVDGRILWANLHLLFWLSLIPFVTGWMGENHFSPVPVALYGCVLFMAGAAYYILVRTLICRHGTESLLGTAIGRDVKGLISLAAYAVAIPLACWLPWISLALYVAVAGMWFIPDRRIEGKIGGEPVTAAVAQPELWTGKPRQGLLLSPRDALLIPFSLAWCGFAVFWTYTATRHSGPDFFTLWGLMFVCIGLYFVFGRFLHDAMIRARTEYSVSAAGVVVKRGGTERHMAIGQWSCLEMEKHADGSGTIRFAPEPGFFAYHNGNAMGFWVPSLERSLQFQRIAEVEQVYQLLVGLARTG